MTMLKTFVGALLAILNCAFWSILIFIFGLIRLINPWRKLHYPLIKIQNSLLEGWGQCNCFVMDALLNLEWEVDLPPDLSLNRSYVVISNHQSWVDIPVAFRLFGGRIPTPKFFLKQELIWLPFVGFACWALDFPFMRRYSREYLVKHPELKGKDLETTIKTCSRYRQYPTSIFNFVEGTRFTREKKKKFKSTYRHLLPPKVGGMAMAIQSLGKSVDSLLDVTIIYQGAEATLPNFLNGKINKIKIQVRRLDIPPELIADSYAVNAEVKKNFNQWVSQIWREKDQLITETYEKEARWPSNSSVSGDLSSGQA